MPTTPHHDRRMFAIGLRLLAVFFFGLMTVCIKMAGEHQVQLPEILFWRQAFALPVVLIWIILGPGLASIRTQRLPTHARRAVLGITGMICNFASIQMLPLAEQVSISFTMPLFATILGAVILHERVGWQRWSAVLIGFVGVLIVVQPGGNALPIGGSVLTLLWSMLVAVISLQLRDLGRTELSTTIVFWLLVFTIPPLALLLPWFMTVHDGLTWMLLLGIGLFGGVGQIALTASLRFAPVSTVVSLDYLGIVGASLYGWLFWDHLPPFSTWFGAPIIIASALFIAWREHRLALVRADGLA